MQIPRRDREWEHWPAGRGADEGLRTRLRHLFTPTGEVDEREAELEALIETRSRDLEEQATRLAETISDLEQREQRTRELRTAVDEMLRRGSSELDERHAELNAYAEELAARERRLVDTERDLADRRRELGAVELLRAAVERREAASEERAAAVEAQAEEIEARLAQVEEMQQRLEEQRGELSTAASRLRTREEELADARATLTALDASLRERQVRVADAEDRVRHIEQLELQLQAREVELAEERAALERTREALTRAVASASAGLGLSPGSEGSSFLLYAQTPSGYELLEAPGEAPGPGTRVVVGDAEYETRQAIRSPFPGDDRVWVAAIRI